MRDDLFEALDDDWARVARSRATRRTLDRWQRSCEGLVGVSSPDRLVALLRAGGNERQYLLRDMIALAVDDTLAARIILQALLPSLVRLAERSGRGDRDAAGALVALAWIEIRGYPQHRGGDVAANLFWDIRKRYVGTRTGSFPSSDITVRRESAVPSAESEAIGRLAVAEVRSTLDRLVQDADAFDLLWTTRVEGHSCADVARRSGASRHGLVQRRRRTEETLRRCLSA